jgi:hypothetical protein
MRLFVITAAAFALAGAAHAQMTLDAYGRPKPLNPQAPIGSMSPVPNMATPAPFTPYRPPSYMRPNLPSGPADPYPHMRHEPGMTPPPQATPADPYPGLHPHRKHWSF